MDNYIQSKKKVNFKGDPSPIKAVNNHKKTRRQFEETYEYNLENRTNNNKNFIVVPEHKYSTRHKTNVLRKQQKLAQIPIKERHTEVLLSWSEMMEQRGDIVPFTSFHSTHSYILPVTIVEDGSNTLNVQDYANDIMLYHRRVEPFFAAPSNYMSRQLDINEKMRSILIDWLIELNLKFDLVSETLFLSVSIIDRFLAKKQVTRKSLQLIGITAVLIATKYEEVWVPELRDFVFISDKAFNRYQIISMEKNILNAINFQLTVPTVYTFLQQFLKISNADKEVSMLAQYLVELALTDYNMLKFSCSHIAASAVYSANKSMLKVLCWKFTLEHPSQYSLESLQTCILTLTKLQKKASIACLQAVFKKFSASKFNGVAKIKHREDMFS
jgi:cyclin B